MKFFKVLNFNNQLEETQSKIQLKKIENLQQWFNFIKKKSNLYKKKKKEYNLLILFLIPKIFKIVIFYL